MENCVFCKIAQGQISSHKIYEDEYSFAFLDKHPINPGHILVIPKTHVPNFYDLVDDDYSHLMLTVKKLSARVNEIMKPHKVGLIVAGWDVPHTHVHIVPMHDYNDITSRSMLEGKKANPSEEELQRITGKLKK